MCLFAHSAPGPWPLPSSLPAMVFLQDYCLLFPLPGVVFPQILQNSFRTSLSLHSKVTLSIKPFKNTFYQKKKKKTLTHNTITISTYFYTALFFSRVFFILCVCVCIILFSFIFLFLPLEYEFHEGEGFVYLQLYL